MTDDLDTTSTALPAIQSTTERLALAGVTAETLAQYVYSFDRGGQTVCGITAEGLNHVATEANSDIARVLASFQGVKLACLPRPLFTYIFESESIEQYA